MFEKSNGSLILLVSTFIIILMILAAIILIVVYIQNNRRLLYRRNLKDLAIKHENELLKTQIVVQENTFQQISREIHDNIGQKLSLAKLYLNMVDLTHYNNAREVIEEVVGIMTTSISDLRDVSRSLSSDLIKNNGFIKAVENEINQLNKLNRYQFKLVLTGDPVFLSSEKELIIFRIIQESLNNIIKHAEATTVEIKIYFLNNQMLEITIEDNGKGFKLEDSINSNGLNNIQQRAKLLNGEAQIHSIIHQGTIVQIKIPLYDHK